MSKNVVLLYSAHYLYADSNPKFIFQGLSHKSSQLILSTLMNENFNLLHQAKKFYTDISINESDAEYLPTFYNTINTKIHLHTIDNNWEETQNHIENYLKNDFKKVLFLFSNLYSLDLSLIESIFNSIPLDSEKIVIGLNKNDKVCFVGLNSPKIELFKNLKGNDLQGEYLIKKATYENAEIQIYDNANICTNIEDVKELYRLYKLSSNKHYSAQYIACFNYLIENYKSLLAF